MALTARVALPVLLLLAGSWTLGPTPPSGAQPAATVELRLSSQSVWNGPKRPLLIRVAATNRGSSVVSDLSLELFVFSPARSRSAFELSLRSDTGTLLAFPFPQQGSLQPHRTRTFTILQPLDVLPPVDVGAIYPLKVEIRSADVALAAIRMPMIVLTERPKVPLNLAWTWVLSAPVQRAPDGLFEDGPLQADVAPGGRMLAMAQALDRSPGARAVDVAISPVLADELRRMAAGYRLASPTGSIQTVPRGTGGAAQAQTVLGALRAVAARPSTEIVATPFGDPPLPALARAGLAGDLPSLLERGRTLVRSVIGAAPIPTVARPPQSLLDRQSLAGLVGQGATTLLLDSGYVPTTPGPTGRPAPVVRLTAGDASADAVVPDPGLSAVAALFPDDPQLAARALLGELAATWFEFPGTPGRGAAVLLSNQSGSPAAFYPDLATLVGASPWLRPVRASTFVSLIAHPGRQEVPARGFRTLARPYVRQLLSARGSLSQFAAVAERARPLADRLRDDLLLSEGALGVSNPLLGRRFIDSVKAHIEVTYDGVRMCCGLVTLYSQTATIPLTISNRSPYAIDGELRLLADRRLAFVDGGDRPVRLTRSNQVITFRVHARTTGRIPLKVQLRTSGSPSAETIAETEIVVRSTAYNRVALFLTIGAALFLLAWWGRRFLPRRKV